uniref:PDZ domain-containing protein n=2 Tax=Hemiselmis andersenii TaxID=464988 RepID=A0A7S1GX21_HEMAN|mmetsp:Transcript_22393/g.54456  ORF Transcript_22393/g.54456 Transcript_22393/m.54456 type:complete len:132 (+) Transcript_22393:185-580(+)
MEWFNFCDCRKTEESGKYDPLGFTARAEFSGSEKAQSRRRRPCGIGVTFVEDDFKALRVKSLVKGGPADQSGKIDEGDILAAVDGYNVYCVNPSEVGALLMGSAGSKVEVSFKKAYSGEQVTVTMYRAESE